MKRPFLWISVAYASGILLKGFCPWPNGPMFIFLLGALPFLWSQRGKKIFLPFFFVLVIVIGILHSRQDGNRPPNTVERFTDSGRVSLEGIVISRPIQKARGKRVTVSFVMDSKNIMRWIRDEEKKEKEAKMNGFRSDPKQYRRREYFEIKGLVQVFLFTPQVIPEAGDRVRLFGYLEKPRPVSNPGEFDYGKYLRQRGISAVFKGFGKTTLRVIRKEKLFFLQRKIASLQTFLERRIDRLFSGETASLLQALILGNRKNISPDLRDDLMKTGTSHLLAISGLHIALLSGSLYLLLIALRVRQKMAAAFALGMVFFHVSISGMGIPVQRAGWMTGAGFVALILERERNSLNTFFMAFFLLLVSDSRNLTNLSFQLSFISVFSLMLLLRYPLENWNWGHIFGNSIAVLIGTFPLVVYYFHVFSPVSILANLVAIPFFHLGMLGAFCSLAIGHILLIGTILIQLSTGCLWMGIRWIQLWASFEWGHWYLTKPTWSQISWYYGLLIALLAWKFLIRRNPDIPMKFENWGLGFLKRTGVTSYLSAALLSTWIFVATSFFYPQDTGASALTVFSAGQNEIAHLQFGRKLHWLINTGRQFPSDQGRWILHSYLRSKGIKNLNGILLTDSGKKHWGGLETVLKNFSVEYLVYPRMASPRYSLLQASSSYKINRKINHVPVAGREKIQIKERDEIQILGMVDQKMILLVSFPNWNLLVVPEMSEKVLDVLQRYPNELLHVQVLFLPVLHSVDEQILNRFFYSCDPDFVIIPMGNRPLQIYLKDLDIPVFDTKTSGAIHIRMADKSVNETDPLFEVYSLLQGRLI